MFYFSMGGFHFFELPPNVRKNEKIALKNVEM